MRVTSPRRTARRRAPAPPRAAEIDEQTALGELYVEALLRTQLRLSMSIIGGSVAVLAGLTALFLHVPAAAGATVGPLPVAWLVLGGGLYPVILAVAAAYRRAVGRVEAEFESMLAEERP